MHPAQYAQPTFTPQMIDEQLRFAIIRLADLLRGGTLPPPAPGISIAWQALPNKTMDALRPQRRSSFMRAPPPTPTTAGMDSGLEHAMSQLHMHIPAMHELGIVSFGGRGSGAGFPRSIPTNDEIYMTPIPEFTAPMIVTTPATPTVRAESAQSSRESAVSDSSRASSDLEGTHSGVSVSTAPTPVSVRSDCTSPSTCSSQDSDALVDDLVLDANTKKMVNEGLKIFFRSGSEALVRVLLEHGIKDYQAATHIATVARGIMVELAGRRVSGQQLKASFRFAVLSLFRNHWALDGAWKGAAATSMDKPYVSLRGVNIAGFVGSLYDACIINADDIHLALDLLIKSPVDFDRLCAMHAIIVHANDKLCKKRYAHGILGFREQLSAQSPQTGHFAWGANGPSRFLVADILSTIDRWFASQTLRRARAAANVRFGAIGGSGGRATEKGAGVSQPMQHGGQGAARVRSPKQGGDKVPRAKGPAAPPGLERMQLGANEGKAGFSRRRHPIGQRV